MKKLSTDVHTRRLFDGQVRTGNVFPRSSSSKIIVIIYTLNLVFSKRKLGPDTGHLVSNTLEVVGELGDHDIGITCRCGRGVLQIQGVRLRPISHTGRETYLSDENGLLCLAYDDAPVLDSKMSSDVQSVAALSTYSLSA